MRSATMSFVCSTRGSHRALNAHALNSSEKALWPRERGTFEGGSTVFSEKKCTFLSGPFFGRGSELINVFLGDSLPLDSCSLKWQWRNWDGIHPNFWSVNCPFSVCHPPRHSYHIVDGFFVPPILRFQSPNLSGSEHAICIPNEALCAVVSHSKAKPHTDIWGLFCSSVLW